MVSLEDFSRIAGSIHAAAVGPTDWTAPLEDIAHTIGAVASGLLIGGGTDRTLRSASLPVDALDTYLAYYHGIDYVLDAVEHGPVGLVHAGSELIARRERSEFNHEWMRPYGLQDGLFVRLTTGPQPTCLIIAAERGGESFANRDRVDLINALLPHWQQALRTQDRLLGLSAAAAAIGDVIDTVRHAVMLIDHRGAIVNANAVAESLLTANDGLRVRNGVLGASQPSADADLQYSVAQAISPARFGFRSGSVITCGRPDGRRPYIIHIVPLGIDDTAQGGRAMLIVIDPEDKPWPPVALLRRVFGMTRSEAEVAVRLIDGDGIKPISDDLNLSAATVKTHLQHVFDKTHTHRQAELVRLLLTVIP